jgi:hypothetical protein
MRPLIRLPPPRRLRGKFLGQTWEHPPRPSPPTVTARPIQLLLLMLLPRTGATRRRRSPCAVCALVLISHPLPRRHRRHGRWETSLPRPPSNYLVPCPPQEDAGGLLRAAARGKDAIQGGPATARQCTAGRRDIDGEGCGAYAEELTAEVMLSMQARCQAGPVEKRPVT